MKTCCSFWEVCESLIVFVLMNARSKFNLCCESSRPFWATYCCLIAISLSYQKAFIYYGCSLIKCVCVVGFILSGWEMTSLHGRLVGKYECRQWKFCRDDKFGFALRCVCSCIRPGCVMICLCVCQSWQLRNVLSVSRHRHCSFLSTFLLNRVRRRASTFLSCHIEEWLSFLVDNVASKSL